MADTAQPTTVERRVPRLPALAAVLAAVAFFSGASAAALPPPQPVSPFVITGFLKSAVLAGTDDLAGGTLIVNNHVVTVPRNTIVLMPAAFLTWAELFTLAPAPYGPSQTGLAMTDVPAPLTTWEVTVQGNRVGDQYIAGLVAISQQSVMTGQGFINSIDYVDGEIRVGGTIGDATTGTRVRINDPLGRFSRAYSPDVRFTVDEDNPTIRTETGFPMCLPRFDPVSHPDPDCPQGNRPMDPATGVYQTIFTMPPPSSVVPGGPDPRKQMPFEVGDYVTYTGELMQDGPQPTAGPLVPPGGTFVSAWGLQANLGIFTTPGADPAYVAIDVTILGVGGAPAPGLPQEATVRTRFEGFSTDPSRFIDLFAVDVDPCTGAGTGVADPSGLVLGRPWGTIDVDPGPVAGRGAVKGRWRFRPPTKVLALPASGTFLPPAREVRAKIRGAAIVQAANGILAGQYHAPITEYLFPENLGIGNPPVPLNFQDFPFLAGGSGPWGGAGINPIASGVVGQLSPWPGLPAPPAPTCHAGAVAAPTADAGPAQNVSSGAAVTLDGGASTDPNGFALSFAWTQVSGVQVSLSSANVARPTFTAPSLASGASLVFSLVVTNTAGLPSAPSTVTITVGPRSVVPLAPIANAGADQIVPSGALVHLDGSASSDPNAPPLPLTYLWTPPIGVTLAGATSAAPSFVAPIVPPGAALVLTFNLQVTNSAGLSASQLVNVTVNPQGAPIANAGPNQAVRSGAAVALDGSASFDPQGLPLTFSWVQVSGPPVTLVGATTATPSFTAAALIPGAPNVTYGFTLTVNNGALSSIPAFVLVAVRSLPDTVAIISAVYRIAKERLTVTASSSDPAAVLTLEGYGANGVQLTLLNGVLTADVVGVTEPATVTVSSSLGGSATSTITRVR